jgi:heat shock protein HslJ
MLNKKSFIVALMVSLSTVHLSAQTESIDFDDLDGNWHLRTMDGKDVREARAILDFDPKKMRLSGFDGCNSMSSVLKEDNNIIKSTKFSDTTMACRESIHQYVRTRLHKTIKEGFSISKTTKDGIDGITVKSSKHELFFKKMGPKQEKKWYQIISL